MDGTNSYIGSISVSGVASYFSVRGEGRDRSELSGLPLKGNERHLMYNPAHPGEVLREYLPEGMTVTDAARRLGVTRQAFSALLNGRAGVSAGMALPMPKY